MNQLCLSATLVEREVLRYTPAGIPIISLKLSHRSTQSEAGGERLIELEMSALATDKVARRVNQVALGSELKVMGFLAARRRHTKALVLHLTGFELQAAEQPSWPGSDSLSVTPI